MTSHPEHSRGASADTDDGLPDAQQRAQLVQIALRLDASGMNRGSTGNLSVRCSEGGFWITPTGMEASALRKAELVRVDEDGRAHGAWQPSSEWPFHRAVYAVRPDLQAVLHTHSVHATALACLRRPLPAFHYMVAVAGGQDVPCVDYHLFGSDALSQVVAAAFVDRQACLLANHGLVAGGRSLAHAFKILQEIEALCEVYLKALAAGEPVLLTDAQMQQAIERFKTYGQTHANPPVS